MIRSETRAALRLTAYLLLTLALIPVQAVAVLFRLRLAERLPRFYHRLCTRILGIRVVVRGRIVRLDPDGQTVGVQFAPLSPAHQQAVDAIIQMMERLEIEASYEQARHPKSSPPMLRAAVAIAVFGATIGIGALYLTIR